MLVQTETNAAQLRLAANGLTLDSQSRGDQRCVPLVHKQKPSQEAKSASSARPGRAFSGQSREVSSILHLQRTIGNQAAQRLLQANAEEFKAGPATTSSTRFAHDFSRILLHANADTEAQPKLTIGIQETYANRKQIVPQSR